MMIDFSRRRTLLLWQFMLVVFATTWIWAPQLNHIISYRTSLISEYETAMQPYSWLFRAGDVVAAVLLGLMGWYYLRKKSVWAGRLLLIIAAGSFIDPLAITSCHIQAGRCVEYLSASSVLHAIETVTTALSIAVLTGYDIAQRRRLVSLGFMLFQIVYLVLSIAKVSTAGGFNLLTQVIYQTATFLWLAWYCRDNLNVTHHIRTVETSIVRRATAAWGALNGVLAIVLSFYHSGILGRIQSLYFAHGSELLAQHGVVTGVVMLYLSRHLLRGEERARQLFMTLIGGEVVKYSVITPSTGLLAFYFVTFCALFVLDEDFDRGTIPIRVGRRFKDAGVLAGLLIMVGAAVFLMLYETHRRLTVASIDHFFDYAVETHLPHVHRRSYLFAHLISSFVITSLLVILWTLFRPIRPQKLDADNHDHVHDLLKQHAQSSEDYFKLWPEDKQYFWSPNRQAFIAYKIVGPIVFALPDPIGVKAQRKRLLTDFLLWAKAHRLTVCFLPIYTESGRTLYESNGLQVMQIGSSAVVNSQIFVDKTFTDKWWRWQKNRARKAGYSYEVAQPPHSKTFLKSLRSVSDKWLTVGGHEERGFALGYYNNRYIQACTVHYLKDETANIVAFTNQLPNLANANLASVDLLRYMPDANNAMPTLLGNVIASTRESGSTHFDLGFVPFAASEEPIIKIAKMLAQNQFSAKGLEQFKNKFDPEWQPTYIAYDGDLADLARIAITLEKAMKLSDE